MLIPDLVVFCPVKTIFFPRKHFVPFQMRYRSLHCCKYHWSYKIKHANGQFCISFYCDKKEIPECCAHKLYLNLR